MDGDVHRILLECTQVGIGVDQSWRPEQYVGEVCGYLHPVIIGDGTADAAEDQRQWVSVAAQRCTVHDVGNGMVDRVGHHAKRFQKLGALLGNVGDSEVQGQLLASPVVIEDLDQDILGQFFLGPSLDSDSQAFGETP